MSTKSKFASLLDFLQMWPAVHRERVMFAFLGHLSHEVGEGRSLAPDAITKILEQEMQLGLGEFKARRGKA